MMDNDNVPTIPAEPHPDFPSGDDLTLLLDIRNMVRERCKAMGLREIGCGVGVDGADASFYLGDRQLSVSVSIFDPAKVSP